MPRPPTHLAPLVALLLLAAGCRSDAVPLSAPNPEPATLADTDASRLGGTWSTTATYGSVAEFNLDIR